MREAVAVRAGKIQDVVELRESILVARAPGTVRLRMLASTINPSDVVTVAGAYPSRTTFPFIAGFEGVGEVIDADHGAAVKLGSQVIPLRSAGCWAELRDIAENDCVIVPDSLSPEQACFAFINPMTALGLIERHIRNSRPVVVTAAASAIADHIAAVLHSRGVPVIGVVRGPRPVRRPHLWNAVIDTGQTAWRNELQLATKDCDIIFDAIGGPAAVAIANVVVAPNLVSYGLLSGWPIQSKLLPSATLLNYFHLRADVHSNSKSTLEGRFERVFDLVQAGVLTTHVAKRFPFRDIRKALEWNANHPGKVMLEMG
ncbi:zinc-dependent alcohol dehydrogenase family protein [Cryobacterium melibiosiphilum]|nr:zinc-dependent alcohol dehydrogenase family protein [Cryobacterium melibiosiphilum]